MSDGLAAVVALVCWAVSAISLVALGMPFIWAVLLAFLLTLLGVVIIDLDF